MKDLSQRKSEAKERQEAYNVLTTSQKITLLDLKLGGGVGAKRQREKLANQLVKESEERVTKVEQPVVGERTGNPYVGGNQRKKSYQKPKRS